MPVAYLLALDGVVPKVWRSGENRESESKAKDAK